MFKNLFKKSYTSINTNDHGSAGVSRAESAKADKRAAEAAQEKPEKIPSRPTAMTPESLRSLWRKCNKCEKPILVQDVKDNLYVCPRCGGYFRMHAYRRIEMLIDEGTFEEWDKEMSVVNPLAFPGYEGKVEAAREKTELNEAVVTGKGKIHGYETVIAVCDSRFLMSSMGHNMGEKIARAVERATEERLPVIIYAASGGARMQEGMISLMQMAKTSAALKRHSEAGLLYISFMTDPTTGGVTASFASLGDIILAEPGALIGFAGPRVIEQTIGQKLPEGFQRAEFQLTHGFVDQIVERKDQKRVLGQILKLHSQEHGWEKWNDEAENHTEAASASKAEKAASVEEGKLKSRKAPFSGIMRQKTLNKIAGRERDAWEAVRQSRSAGRLNASDYIRILFDDFTEFHGDRYYGDDMAVIGGVASFYGMPVTVIGQERGKSPKDSMKHNFGMPSPEGYRKALRLMKQAAKEAGNMVDLDSSPTKLIDIVRIGKQLLMTRGSLTTFSIANDVAKYFAIIPALFMGLYPGLSALNIMGLHSPQSAVLSAIIYNALIIIALIPLALKGVKYREVSAGKLLSRNLLIYGLGGLAAPFIFVKLIDMLLVLLGLV